MINTEVIVLIGDEEVEVDNYYGERDDWESASAVVQNDSAIPDALLLTAIKQQNWGGINSALDALDDKSAVPTTEMRDFIDDYFTGGIDDLSGWLDNVSVDEDDEDYFENNKDWILESPNLTEQYFDAESFVRDLDMSGDVVKTTSGAIISNSN